VLKTTADMMSAGKPQRGLAAKATTTAIRSGV
jgi:hypothetical protein